MNNDEIKIIDTNNGVTNGQDKCPKCGATDISLNVSKGLLRCNFCRFEFEAKKVDNLTTNLNELSGVVMASGASDIKENSEDIITLKCTSCGAEVVIDTNSSNQARCHWCRNTLSINEQIPNGSVPDVVLPFSITKDEARNKIEEFVGKRKFFAHPKFKNEFTTENIMGVYFPYMLVDINGTGSFSGQGEHLLRSYTRGTDENKRTYYDAEVYNVKRDFDIIVNGLSIESNSDKLNNSSSNKTNNIINSIMPFDIENCVKWNANYIKGFNSEKRDVNVNDLKPIVEIQTKDIARHSLNNTLKHYDRGVCWSNETLHIKGEQWKAAHLPVWLYSYQEVKGDKSLLHYVAVNARTKEVMGSVPIHMPMLILFSILVEILGFLGMIFVEFDYEWLFLLSGFIFFFIMYGRYRNKSARHTYEKDTKTELSNVKSTDDYIGTKTGLSNSMMEGANNKRVLGKNNSIDVLGVLTGSENISNVISKNINLNKDNLNDKNDKNHS